MSPRQSRFFWGGLAIAFYVAHGTTWLLRGVPASLIWACHLGCLLVGIAVVVDIPLLNAIGVQWLALGNILWFTYLAGGGELIMTSQLTHLGGIAIGIWFARRRGFPRGSWLAALLGIAALHFASRFVSPPTENINLACGVDGNWKGVFPDFWSFRLFLLVASAALFYVLERAARYLWKGQEKTAQ